jgi:segregation and condensation protein B
MSPEQIVEATLFASQTPLTPAELARADDSLTADAVRDALVELRRRYDREDRAFQVYQLGDGYQLLTRPEYAPYLERFDSVPRSPTLSDAALETLAIVAYRQPIGRVEIEEIRGVGSSSVLTTLQDWELIEVVGRGEGLGRPLLYGTTRRFLDHFGFQDLSDLPATEEIPVSLREEPVDFAGEEEPEEGAAEPEAGVRVEAIGADGGEDAGEEIPEEEAVRRIRALAEEEDAREDAADDDAPPDG